MSRMVYWVAVASFFTPAVVRAQEVVTNVRVEVHVGNEDKAKVGYLNLEVEYLGDTLLKKAQLGSGDDWFKNKLATTPDAKVAAGTNLNLAKPVKLTATLGDNRGPGKHNNCRLKFKVELTTDKGNIYVGETAMYFFDTDNHGGEEGKGATPSNRYEITLKKK